MSLAIPFRIRIVVLAFVGAAALGFGAVSSAQSTAAVSIPSRVPRQRHNHAPPSFFENAEIGIHIPPGWSVSVPDYDPYSKTQFPSMTAFNALAGLDPRSGLILTKNGYTLALAYETGHTSGVEGGRFEEEFRMPWIEDDQGSECSLHFKTSQHPVDGALIFTDLILDPSNPDVRKVCVLPENFANKANGKGSKRLMGKHRWFAGSFSTATQGWFMDSSNPYCADKAYALTSPATTPNELPLAEDPALKNIVNEAIGIVGSIRYKRCAPSSDVYR